MPLPNQCIEVSHKPSIRKVCLYSILHSSYENKIVLRYRRAKEIETTRTSEVLFHCCASPALQKVSNIAIATCTGPFETTIDRHGYIGTIIVSFMHALHLVLCMVFIGCHIVVAVLVFRKFKV